MFDRPQMLIYVTKAMEKPAMEKPAMSLHPKDKAVWGLWCTQQRISQYLSSLPGFPVFPCVLMENYIFKPCVIVFLWTFKHICYRECSLEEDFSVNVFVKLYEVLESKENMEKFHPIFPLFHPFSLSLFLSFFLSFFLSCYECGRTEATQDKG